MPSNQNNKTPQQILDILQKSWWSTGDAFGQTVLPIKNYPRLITIGGFDGVHTGHQKILQMMQKKSTDLHHKFYNFDFKTRVLVITFDPLPKQFFNPKIQPLLTLKERVFKLHQNGADEVLILPFSSELQAISAEDFLQFLLVQTLHLHTFFLGKDHRFGSGGRGDFDFLCNQQPLFNYLIELIPLYFENGKKLSASDLRRNKT